MGLLGMALGRPRFVLFAVVLVTGAALWALSTAGQSMFPRIELSRVEIFVRAPQMPPARIRTTVVEPIEAALALQPGLQKTRSVSTQNQGEIELDFEPRVAIERARDRVEAVLASLKPALPAGLKITTIVESPAIEPVVSYALWSDQLSQSRLQRALERGLTPAFAGTPGLERVTVFGGAPPAGGPATQQASFNGRHAVMLNAYGFSGADAVGLQRAFSERVARLAAALPATHSARYWDQTRLIEASQRSLRNAILIGALLALLVIYLFLRSLALTAAAAVVIPIAVVLSTGLLVAGGLSLNLMTLGGLAIAVGLIIDEVIVVVEAIAREVAASPHAPRLEAIRRALRRICVPLLASTAANLVVFVPLALLSGIPGFFFRALALTLAIALVVSIGLSLFVAPLLAGILPLSTRSHQRPKRLEAWYARVLEGALMRPFVVYAGAAAILAATALLFARIPTDFLPAMQEGQFEIKYVLPAGTSLAATDTIATELERRVVANLEVRAEGRLTGIDTDGYLPTPPSAGTIRVSLKPGAQFESVAGRLRLVLSAVAPEATFEFHQLLEDQINDLTGAPEPIQIAIYGQNQATLIGLARTLAPRIATIRGIDDLLDGVVLTARPSAHADARALAALTNIEERNGRRVLLITAGIEGRPLSEVMQSVRAALASVKLPANYSIEIGGADQSQRASFAEFMGVLGIAIVLVFAVLLATFNSFRLPLVILATIPLSPIGVALALKLTNTPLNVSSFMGLLLLSGVVVRNGILLIDAANRRHAAGAPVRQALLGAGTERLRPILMTVLAAIGALLPLALGFGSGSEMERPLAIAVIGGLATSTLFTLVLVPTLYAAAVRRDRIAPAARASLVALARR